MGRCRLGYLMALALPSIQGSCHLARWSSRSTRCTVGSSFGAEIYAFSGLEDHVVRPRNFYEFSRGAAPKRVGLGVLGSLFTHLSN